MSQAGKLLVQVYVFKAAILKDEVCNLFHFQLEVCRNDYHDRV